MALAHVAGGQVGSDTTGNFSQSFAAGTCNAAIVFILSAATSDPVSGDVTYGGVAMKYLGKAIDNTTEACRVDAYFLGGLGFPSGTQTIAFTQSGGATKRVYAASASCAADHVIDLYKNALIPVEEKIAFPDPGATSVASGTNYDKFFGFAFLSVETTLANPSNTLAVPAERTVYGYGSLVSGITATSLSVANGTQIAEANLSGGTLSGSGSFARASAAVNNGNLVIGWTASADDAAACWVYIEECKIIGGNVTKEASPEQDAVIQIDVSDNANGETNRRAYMTVESDGSGDWQAYIPVGLTGWATCTFNDAGTLYVSLPHGPISST